MSTDKQDNNNQLSELMKRYPEAEVIEEVASGAKTRPLLDCLLASLVKGDTLVVAALDRLGRSTRDVLEKVELLNRNGVILVSVREGFDLNTPFGQFGMTIMVAFAQLERSILIDRVKTALKAKVAQGVKLGRPRKTGTVCRTSEYRRRKRDGY